MHLPEERIKRDEICEWIKTRPNHLSDYYINDEENDMLNYTIDYSFQMKAITRTYEESLTSEQSVKWRVAMKEEMDVSKENETL